MRSFPSVQRFTASTFRKHRALLNRAWAWPDLVPLNWEAKWADLVSFLIDTKKHDRGNIIIPFNFQNMEIIGDGSGNIDNLDIDFNMLFEN